MKRIALLTISFTLLLCPCFLTGCSKTGADDSFHFNSNGGPAFFDVELDPESILISIDGNSSKQAWCCQDDVDDIQWFTELSWLRAYYFPIKNELYISADKNYSGKSRRALITGSNDGDNVTISIRQD